MITDLLMALFSIPMFLVGGLLHIINVAIPDQFETAIIDIFSYFRYMTDIFPVTTLMSVMTFALLAEMGFVAFKATMWAVGMLPGGKRLDK